MFFKTDYLSHHRHACPTHFFRLMRSVFKFALDRVWSILYATGHRKAVSFKYNFSVYFSL